MSEEQTSVLFVLGLPHSGTEVLTQALVDAGAVLAPDASDDPFDLGAPFAIARLNAKMLAAVGASPANPGPLLVGGETLAQARASITKRLLKTRRKRAVRMLGEALTPGSTTVITDPHIALLMPFWQSIVAEAGIAARFVHVHRNPLALADLARQHAKQPTRRGWFLWHYLTLEILEAAPDAAVVAASALIDDPAAAAQALLGPASSPKSELSSPLDAHSRDAEPFNEFPLFPAQSRDLHALLERWHEVPVADRIDTVAALRARFDDAMLVGAMGRPMRSKDSVDQLADDIEAGADEPTGPARPLILHYHLFKNAGSSIDAMLRENFGDRWIDHEFPRKGRDNNHAALIAFLEEREAVDAFSSHTMLLPVPKIRGRSIIPIIFVRHPLIRLRSAYGFERRQDADTKGAKLAKEHDFAGYVAALLKEPRNRQARNFQTVRFAFGTPGDAAHELERAMTTLANLPFVGLVEQYERSVARLCKLVRPAFPDFEPLIVQRNAERPGDTRPIDDRVAELRSELGETMYDAVVEANRDDISLFEHVCTLYPGERD